MRNYKKTALKFSENFAKSVVNSSTSFSSPLLKLNKEFKIWQPERQPHKNGCNADAYGDCLRIPTFSSSGQNVQLHTTDFKIRQGGPEQERGRHNALPFSFM